MTKSSCGNLWLSLGSHLRDPTELRDMDRKVSPDQTLELKLPVGSAVVWRTAVWHCVGPNQSPKVRKIMHVGYHYRWLCPGDYIQQDSDLLARCSPIRQRLLGALPSGDNPLGADSDIAPASQYWQTKCTDVPLRAWAESQVELTGKETTSHPLRHRV